MRLFQVLQLHRWRNSGCRNYRANQGPGNKASGSMAPKRNKVKQPGPIIEPHH